MARFGKFELDTDTRRLRRDGVPVHLGPKAFDLLSLLVEASPKVVSKVDLHERLWPRGIVSDATLVALVKELRRALDDNDRAAPVIRTVHRVGYSLEPQIEHPARVLHWLWAGERTLPLAPGENIVGRASTAQVRIDHSTVSRRHARIVIDSADARLEDLGSKNGTSVDGARLEVPFTLRDGDQVAFGEVPFTYRRDQGGLATVTQASSVASPSRP